MRRALPILLVLLSTAVLLVAAPKPPNRAKGPTPKGNCAVCGMYVANFPEWAAVVSFKDGTEAWFDGPKDLFTFLLDLKQFAPKQSAAAVSGVKVKDYYGLKYIDGTKAFYVLGGDVLGPMGKELVPFATEAAAKEFLKDHHGQRVLTYQEVTPGTMKGLD